MTYIVQYVDGKLALICESLYIQLRCFGSQENNVCAIFKLHKEQTQEEIINRLKKHISNAS